MITYPIVEIFSSIQGEGCNLGKRANFIRFAGCNLKCPWCDTNWHEAKRGNLSIEEIAMELDPCVDLVVLTGGEPLIQKNLQVLIDYLFEEGFAVAIETNGTISAQKLKEQFPGLWITCSPKPETDWQIAGKEDKWFDELKYVVDDNFMSSKIIRTEKPIWLQPEGGNMQAAWKKALYLQQAILKPYSLDIRIGVQLHKIMEVR